MTSKRTNNRRLFPAAKSPRPDHYKGRQDEAKERLEAWNKLSPQEQLKALDSRPGESKKQRARLLAKINKTTAVEPTATVTATQAED
jgi:hypothetical protein